ncbi:MAG: DNA polymerase III subunit delta', partial [Gammaproteobacteria bacterium]|nr:DNA polymerase III subunit delta' [Gammaproteobacteria bacterium]
AALLLCTESLNRTEACGKCSSCLLLRVDNHPDLVVVEPQEKGKAIKIDQIRDLIADLNNTSHQGGYKVVIIESAELLNIAGANALLKTLEEPSSQTMIILTSAHPMMLPATIRSRCQTLSIYAPKYFVAIEWLKKQAPYADADLLLALAENAPLKALSLVESDVLAQRQRFFEDLYDLQQGKISSVQMTTRSLDWGLDNFLVTLIYVVSDLIKIKFGTDLNIVNQDQLEKLRGFAAKTTINKLHAYKDHLYKIRRHLTNKININQQLAIENLLINWLQVFSG